MPRVGPATTWGKQSNQTSRRGLLALLASWAFVAPARGVSASPGAPSGGVRDFDDHAGNWRSFVDPPQPNSSAWAVLDSVPSPDRSGRALSIGIRGGAPYTGVQGYAEIDGALPAQAVELELDWRFSDTTWNNAGGASRVQAVELTINKWSGGQRFEWALQWQNVSDGLANAAAAPNWRVWTGNFWQDLGISQRLAPNQWHAFRLRGQIAQNEVHYVELRSDDETHELTNAFASVPTDGADRMTVALQIDGNYDQSEYDCLFDRVSVRWWDASPW